MTQQSFLFENTPYKCYKLRCVHTLVCKNALHVHGNNDFGINGHSVISVSSLLTKMKCRGIYLLILVLQSVYLHDYLCFCLLFSSRTWASRLFFDNLICWISFRSLEVWSCSVWSFWFLSSWSRVRIFIRSWSRLDFVAFSVSYYGFQFVQARRMV